jgi:sugar lactone lactonase YvrE
MRDFTNAVRVVASGLTLGESARWHDGRFWCADWGPGEIVRFGDDWTREVVAKAPAPPLSFDFLPDGRMLIAPSRGGPMLRREPDGGLVMHADLATVAGHGWNEIVCDERGNTYVNGAGYNAAAGEGFMPGIVALVTPDGRARRVAKDIHFPNGMAVTPDNATLIVAESYGRRLTAFDIAADGGLSGRRVWADLGETPPDGICCDAEGAVWVAEVPGKRCLRVAEGGTVLAQVRADRACFACMLGGPDRRTLYINGAEWLGMDRMAEMQPTGLVLAAAVEVPGAGWP